MFLTNDPNPPTMKEQMERPKREEFIIEYKNQPISPTMYVRTDWQQYSKALEAYIDHLTAEQGDGYDNYKKVAVEFFYWWWNKGGTNTDDGFDEWAKREESKKLLKSPELTVREVVEWMKNNKKWLKVHSTGEVESNIASGHFISEDELTKIIRP